ncbi:MAG: transcriptional regulator NrdR [Spirochaetes bacterium]|nr:transcriptional regulator NrdR [Brevinematales bacterium]MCL1959210.1 transcriptional regulator NrdR [Spirochaetota bacterium]
MRCPHCGTVEDKVVESRTLANGDAVRRRRECINCGYRFTSYERIDERQFMVIKRDGRREPFERSKLERGIVRALEKRPFSQMQIENLVNEIEDETAILSKGSREISSTIIGDLVLERLGKLDNFAYIRFASVYKHFKDLNEFIEEIKKVGTEMK